MIRIIPRFRTVCHAALALVIALGAPGGTMAAATTLRWGSEADAASLDPYTRNEGLQLSLTGNVYEPLVRRTPTMTLEPGLAVSWQQVQPTRWRFHLRPDVLWQDGSRFTASDVLFSLARVQSQASLLRPVAARIVAATAPDDLTVEFETAGPDPILPQEITTWYMMSQAWCTQHDAREPALLASGGANYAGTHAMGTGPFSVLAREPDRRTELQRNPAWWDSAKPLFERVEMSVLGAASTRVAALIAGDLDLITAVPPQDAARVSATAGLKLLRLTELRTIFLGMDQWRGELLKSDIHGANPFRDVRVRRAVRLAIDEAGIATKIMRGIAHPTALLWGPGVTGYDPSRDQPAAADPARARDLLREAGYGKGFGVTLDCPNDRYVMDEAICTALVPMLARIGIRVTVEARPKARFFAEIGPPEFRTSFYLLGWTPMSGDALNALVNLAGSRAGTRGAINFGGYANPALDALLERIATEPEAAARSRLIAQAADLLRDDVAYVPLHQQVLLWGARSKVNVPQSPDGFLPLRLVSIDD